MRSGGNAAGGALPRLAGADVTARRGRGGPRHAHSGRAQENEASEGEKRSGIMCVGGGGGVAVSVSAPALLIFEDGMVKCGRENNVAGIVPFNIAEIRIFTP